MTQQIKNRAEKYSDLMKSRVPHARIVEKAKHELRRFGLEGLINVDNYARNIAFYEDLRQAPREKQLDRLPFGVLFGNNGLWIPEDQALAWAQMSFEEFRNPATNGFKEVELLKRILENVDFKREFLNGHDYVSLVDLGCGNGQKAKLVIENLRDVVVCYYPVDISPYMNAVALANIEELAQRDDCILADNNPFFYTVLSILRDKSNPSLEEMLSTAREAQKTYEHFIKFMETLLQHPLFKKDYAERQLVTESYAERYMRGSWYSGFLNGFLKKRYEEIKQIIEKQDPTQLKKLYNFYEVLGRHWMGELSSWKEFKNLDIDSLFKGERNEQATILRELGTRLIAKALFFPKEYIDGFEVFEDKLYDATLIFSMGHVMNRGAWESILDNGTYANDDITRSLINEPGKIQFTAPSVGICAEFNDIDKVIQALNLTHVFEEEPRMVMLLGQTLGNFDEQGRRNLCQRIYNNLSPGDMFLVGVELRPEDNDPLFDEEIDKITRYYKGGKGFAKRSLPRCVRKNEKTKFLVNYDRTSNDVDIRFVLDDKGKHQEFPVIRSHKFTFTELHDLLKSVGFQTPYTPQFHIGNARELDGQKYDSRKEYVIYLVKK